MSTVYVVVYILEGDEFSMLGVYSTLKSAKKRVVKMAKEFYKLNDMEEEELVWTQDDCTWHASLDIENYSIWEQKVKN